MKSPGDSPGAAARCSNCGASFSCGALAGATSCWCMARPPVAPVAGETCLCPACLERVRDARPPQDPG